MELWFTMEKLCYYGKRYGTMEKTMLLWKNYGIYWSKTVELRIKKEKNSIVDYKKLWHFDL